MLSVTNKNERRTKWYAPYTKDWTMLKPLIAIVVALILSMLIAIAGTQHTPLFYGMPLFII